MRENYTEQYDISNDESENKKIRRSNTILLVTERT
jgi:hypothetical protein